MNTYGAQISAAVCNTIASQVNSANKGNDSISLFPEMLDELKMIEDARSSARHECIARHIGIDKRALEIMKMDVTEYDQYENIFYVTFGTESNSGRWLSIDYIRNTTENVVALLEKIDMLETMVQGNRDGCRKI